MKQKNQKKKIKNFNYNFAEIEISKKIPLSLGLFRPFVFLVNTEAGFFQKPPKDDYSQNFL